MKYAQIAIEKLIPYARNAKKHSAAQIAKVAASIQEFGFINPVIIDKKFGIIAGHCRVEAARKLGLPVVPCIQCEHLTETQKRAYVLADNKLAELGEYDDEMLALEISELKESDFDVLMTGFDEKEIAKMLDFDEPDESEPKEKKSTGNVNKFEMLIICKDEFEQESLFNEFTTRGVQCVML